MFDIAQHKIIATSHFDDGIIYNTLRPGPGGTLYGLGTRGIFSIDETDHSVKMVVNVTISGGMAIRGRDIYFTVGADIVSYRLPADSAEE